MYINPYDNLSQGSGKWLKANFHSHAGTGPGTCGVHKIDKVVKTYKECGYDVLCISNHDLFTDVSHLKDKYQIALINGFEYSKSEHMLCIGCKGIITAEHQEAINQCTEEGGFSVLCHPHYLRKDYWSPEKIDFLEGYTGIEVFNGVIGRLQGTGLAEDTWDYLLSNGKIVWGFGNDDFHRWYDLNNSWNMVYSPSNSEEDIITSIKAGCFYFSSGLYLEEFIFENNTITIKAQEDGCYKVKYEYIFIGKDGKALKRQRGASGKFTITDEPYVRVKVMGEQGYCLWTQPIYGK